ncbi:hypothetical protein VLK81_07005 [Citroniella saccharovorans]|uniref:Phage MuF C-terminal domain-containing protein n=2 Tax=Citroniella saccharovorans TaxID=2053367 RepID=A0AAW9MQC4_9FIRM|nr:hypothetical protein [Citroniella saccharovorans]
MYYNIKDKARRNENEVKRRENVKTTERNRYRELERPSFARRTGSRSNSGMAISREAGRPTSRQSYPRQLSILSYLGGDSIRPSTSRRGEGSDGRANNAQDRGEGTRVSGKISDNLLDKNETGLSTGFNRGESRQSQKNVLGQNIDSTLEKNTNSSDGLYEKRETINDEKLENTIGGRSRVSNNDFSINRDNDKRNNRIIENDKEQEKEADEASFFNDENIENLTKTSEKQPIKVGDVVKINEHEYWLIKRIKLYSDIFSESEVLYGFEAYWDKDLINFKYSNTDSIKTNNYEILTNSNELRLNKSIEDTINKNTNRYDSILISSSTLDILKKVGLEDLPIFISQKHILSTMHEKGKNPHWHEIKKDFLVNINNFLNDPSIIMDSLSKDDSVVLVTTQLDNDNLPIMITIKPNGKGIYEAETLESNYITSIYGKDNFEKFIDRNIKENKILYFDKEKIQSLERFARLQLSGNFSNFESKQIIHQSRNIVNTDKKAIQNSDLFENSSKDNIQQEKSSNNTGDKEKIKVNPEIDSIKNFAISEDLMSQSLTPSERLNNNIQAISMLNKIENGEIKSNLAAQQVLEKYVGWGGLADVFDEEKEDNGFKQEHF